MSTQFQHCCHQCQHSFIERGSMTVNKYQLKSCVPELSWFLWFCSFTQAVFCSSLLLHLHVDVHVFCFWLLQCVFSYLRLEERAYFSGSELKGPCQIRDLLGLQGLQHRGSCTPKSEMIGFTKVVSHQGRCTHTGHWVVFHPGGLSSGWLHIRVIGWSFIRVVCHQGGCTYGSLGGLSSWWSLIRVVLIRMVSCQGSFDQDGLPSGWLHIRVTGWSFIMFRAVSHQGRFSSGWSLIMVVSHPDGLTSGWSFFWGCPAFITWFYRCYVFSWHSMLLP